MAEMLENLENENTAAQPQELPEGEAITESGSPEITEDNLFDLVDSGEITLEEANAFLDGQGENAQYENSIEGQGERVYADTSSTASGSPSPQGEGLTEDSSGGIDSEGAKAGEPYRVFQTEDDFQRVFDNAWNKRYGKMMHERDTERTTHQDLLNDLGSLLGVAPEQAAQELKNRKRRLEAERSGVDPEEYSARMQAEEDRDFYKNQYEAQQKQAQAREAVARIRAQGEAITRIDPTFHIDEAMNNPEFAKVVFALSPALPDKAVMMAYQTVMGKNPADGQISSGNNHSTTFGGPPPLAQGRRGGGAPAPVRPHEGGLAGMRQEKRPVDYGRMSDRDILSIADRVMRGEKV